VPEDSETRFYIARMFWFCTNKPLAGDFALHNSRDPGKSQGSQKLTKVA